MFDFIRFFFKSLISGKSHERGIANGIGMWLLAPFVVLGALLLALFMIVATPIYWLLLLVAAFGVSRRGRNLRITENGVEVFSKKEGVVARFPWSDIASLRRSFNTPPCSDCELVLKTNEIVRLEYAEFDELSRAFGERGIPVDGRFGTKAMKR